MTIRQPASEDTDALGEIHVKAWQLAYRGGLMPDGYLETLLVEVRAQLWREDGAYVVSTSWACRRERSATTAR